MDIEAARHLIGRLKCKLRRHAWKLDNGHTIVMMTYADIVHRCERCGARRHMDVSYNEFHKLMRKYERM